jgi:hypothetical protein
VPLHAPFAHTSFSVQALPSSHAAALLVLLHAPLVQTSLVHSLASSQSALVVQVATQALFAHASSAGQSSLFSHWTHVLEASMQIGVDPEQGSGPSMQTESAQTSGPSQKSPLSQSALVEHDGGGGGGLKIGHPETKTSALTAIHSVPQRENPRTVVRSKLVPSNVEPSILVDLQIRECGVFRCTRRSFPVFRIVQDINPGHSERRTRFKPKRASTFPATAGQNSGRQILPEGGS